MNCRTLIEFLTDYLDGRLTLSQRILLRLHLLLCGHCRAYLRQMKQTVQTLGRLPEESVPPEALNQLLQRFRDWKK